jgi:hypothetical protein
VEGSKFCGYRRAQLRDFRAAGSYEAVFKFKTRDASCHRIDVISNYASTATLGSTRLVPPPTKVRALPRHQETGLRDTDSKTYQRP